jgi:hypothetical protein
MQHRLSVEYPDARVELDARVEYPDLTSEGNLKYYNHQIIDLLA